MGRRAPSAVTDEALPNIGLVTEAAFGVNDSFMHGAANLAGAVNHVAGQCGTGLGRGVEGGECHMDTLFGTELSTPIKFAIAFPIILALLVGFIYAVRRFGVGALGGVVTTRGRQPRLGVTDVAMVGDGRRRLLLIRRDNVEHLIMTGGPSDIVIEQNIVRATPAVPVRETPPARVTADALPRAVPLAETGMWPLQPEPIARPQRTPVPAPEDEAADAPWAAQSEPVPRQAIERESTRESTRESARDSARENAREIARDSIKDNVLRVQTSDRLSGLV